jgi:hypothetical protein
MSDSPPAPPGGGPPPFFWIVLGLALLIAIGVIVVITLVPVAQPLNAVRVGQ